MDSEISIAMATYNGERYLKEQLDSLAAQIMRPLELVVCDDGSTDSTINIINAFAVTSPFTVRLYINDVNLGYAANFFKAAELCKGDWIAFCDQDDVWKSNKILRIQRTIKSSVQDNLMLIGHTSLIADIALKTDGKRCPDIFSDRYIEAQKSHGLFSVVGFSMACRSSLVRDIDWRLRPFVREESRSVQIGHDQWLGMLANAVGGIYLISEPLALWRRHPKTLTTAEASSGIAGQAKASINAIGEQPYFQLANMANEFRLSLKDASKTTKNSGFARRLSDAAVHMGYLSDNFKIRGELYSQIKILDRLRFFKMLLFENAYIGEEFSSLGMKSMLKDIFFVCRLIG